MNEILIVPDIHGRNFWKPALKYQGSVIFLGDYTDPYSHEGFTQQDAYNGLLQIVNFKKENPDRIILLVGNHELHYYNSRYEASRFSEKYYERYHEILTGKETAELFQVCKQIGNYLFVHAGITKQWYKEHKEELQFSGSNIETQINSLFQQNKKSFAEISYYRGGYHIAGSPLWADIEELTSETEPFDDKIVQIIGHTQILDENPLIGKNFLLLDNKQLYLLKNDEIIRYDQ
jgi:predicted MPP superfamily phosphohydrolase